MTFAELQQSMFQLYTAGQYQAALDLVEREMDRFPDQIGHTYYWRACFLALLGRPAEALGALQAGLDRSVWFAPNLLEEDPDLKSLQHLPGFEPMLTVCRERRAEAQARAVPQLLTMAPHTGNPPYPLLVALHGNNSNARITGEHWAPAADQGWFLALPQSSQIIMDDIFEWNDRDRAVGEVKQHWQNLLAEQPVDPEQAVIGGFSMGGGTAIYMALSKAVQVRGFVTLGPYLFDVETLRPMLAEGRCKGMRGAIVVGQEDQGCLEASRAVAALMKEHGLACQLTELPGLAHVYPGDFAQYMLQGLAFVMGEQ